MFLQMILIHIRLKSFIFSATFTVRLEKKIIRNFRDTKNPQSTELVLELQFSISIDT